MTPNFTFAEAVRTSTGLVNMPTPEIAANIGVTAMKMQQIRELLNAPVIVNSWYRSPEVNKAVGGSKNSDHMSGYAVDFKCPKFGTPYEVAVWIYSNSNNIYEFDQLILEYGWVHLSFAPALRGHVMTKRSTTAPYVQGLHK